MEDVKIIIYALGDPSVGIFSTHEEITIKWPAFYDDEDERSRVRTVFHEAFSELYGDNAQIWFGDECPDCLCQGVGHKKGCPSEVILGGE